MTLRFSASLPAGYRTTVATAVARTLRTALPFEVEVHDAPEKRVAYDSVCACVESSG